MVREPEDKPTVRDSPDVATFANRRHIALRAALNVVAHDALNPLGMISSAAYLLEVANKKAKTNPATAGTLTTTVDDFVRKIRDFAQRTIQEVRVLQDIIDGRETLASPKRIYIASALGAVVIAINGGGKIMVLKGKSDKSLSAHFGMLELSFSTLLLCACEAAGASITDPVTVHMEDMAETRATRISLSTPATIDGESLMTAQNIGSMQRPLGDCAAYLQSHGATVRWGSSPQQALLTLEIPFVREEDGAH